jgi:flagellar biosynthesis protein FlhA
VLGLLPGIPMLPFLGLGGGAAALAWSARQRKRAASAAEAAALAAPAAAAAASAAAEEPIATALKIDDLKIELGYALLPLVNGPDGSDRLTEQIKALRRLVIEMGCVMPAVRILATMQLERTPKSSRSRKWMPAPAKSGQFMYQGPCRNRSPAAFTPSSRLDCRLRVVAGLKEKR